MITEKKCSICNNVLDVGLFSKKSGSKDGLQSFCKTCSNERNRLWVKNNKDKHRERVARWRDKNPEALAKMVSEYQSKNANKISEYQKEWYKNNKEHCNKRTKEWRKNNAEKDRENSKLYRKNNPQKFRDYCKSWATKYPHKVTAKTVRREASKLKATPSWLSDSHIDEILDLYTMAKMFRIYTGIEYHVDHIVPLRGETVCGLHVPWNLQLLPWNENLSKQNKYWPDMPD